MPHDSDSWQPRNSFTDTAFQILKIVDYLKFMQSSIKESPPEIRHLLADIRIPWLYHLNDRDRRRVYAWPHAQDDGINTFRLDDHYWIWNALESMENLGMDFPVPRLPKKHPIGGTKERETRPGLEMDSWLCLLENIDQENEPKRLDSARERFSEAIRRLGSTKVQKGLLQRFTTENDYSRQRMLALTRSPRETRFLLHARDTALFYKQGKSFFPDTSFQELWTKTLDSQVLHEENEDTNWQNTLRYALGILVATNDSRLNKRTSMGLLRNSTEVIIGVSTHSGFIYGELEAESHMRSRFTQEADRDYFYHVSLEIPYILLTYGSRIDQEFQNPINHTQEKIQQPVLISNMVPTERRASRIEDALYLRNPSPRPTPRLRVQEPAIDVPESPADQFSLTDLQKLRRVVEKTQDIAMKKAIPFSGLMDVRNITNIPEEWLYDYPEFLLTNDMKMKTEEDANAQISQNDHLGSVVLEGSKSGSYRDFDNPARNDIRFPTDTASFVANAPKQKLRSKKERRRQDEEVSANLWNNKGLWSIIGKKRTAETAKKRFIWLPHPNAETAFLCWSASTEGEKPNMSLFFDRHLRYEQHFRDSTTMILNSWQTELHLSFYTLVEKRAPWHIGIPEPIGLPFPSGSMELRRASMGFRFDGDLFDRYWTCHFVQFVPCLETPANSVPRFRLWKRNGSHESLDSLGASADKSKIPAHEWDFDFHHDALGRYKEKHWWQRKVLELYLLKRILTLVIRNSSQILDAVRENFDPLDSEKNSPSKGNWKGLERLLQVVDDDLNHILKTLEQWRTREKDRSTEPPRWTRNDERKYRSYINNFRSSTEQQKWELEIHRDRVGKLLDALKTSLEKIQADFEHSQNDLERKREENIRYFTYVTVIFLPLGFAASFFSMVCGRFHFGDWYFRHSIGSAPTLVSLY